MNWAGMAAGPIAGLSLLAVVAQAQETVPTEVSSLGSSVVTVHLHPFLTAEDLTVLRLVATNTDALAVFVPDGAGFAALAISPDDGFIAGGVPAQSAVALAGFADAKEAQAASLAECDAARTTDASCVIVLEIGPAE